MSWIFIPAIGAVALFVDAASKAWAERVLDAMPALEVAPFLRLRLGYNSGVAFSLFAGLGASTYISIFTSILIASLAWMAAQAQRDLERLGLALMIGGALGNLGDRLGDGVVTDFIDVHAGDWHFPTFNLADVAITSGVLLLLAQPMRDACRRPQHGG
jgi:signal peptidase II